MNRDTNASDDNERTEPESASSNGPSLDPQSKPPAPRDDQDDSHRQFIEELKRGLEKTRLPADLREQILAELPPPEERERLLREMQEKGGMSFEQFMESLGLDVHPQP